LALTMLTVENQFQVNLIGSKLHPAKLQLLAIFLQPLFRS